MAAALYASPFPFYAETGGCNVIEFIAESEAETIENLAYRC